MSIKLTLRPYGEKLSFVNSSYAGYETMASSPSHKNIKSFSSSQILTLGKGSQSEIQLEYIVPSSTTRSKNSLKLQGQSSSHSDVRVLDLKIFIANYFHIRPDMLNLYVPTQTDKVKLLNDKDAFTSNNCFNPNECRTLSSLNVNQQKISNSSRSFEMLKSAILLYKISREKQKVVIDFFQNSIDQIILMVSPFCSIYMLKFLINEMLMKHKNFKQHSQDKNQSIYGSGLIDNSNNKIISKENSNKKFEDNDKIEGIVEYYINVEKKNNSKNNIQMTGNSAVPYALNFILVESIKKKVSMGIDFSFKYLNNFRKIGYDNNAPFFREVSDGLNLIVYCLNKDCEIYNQYFTCCKGYGQFSLLNELNNIFCPKCCCKNCDKKDLRSIGMINAKWCCKGVINVKKRNLFESDGYTLENNKFFALSEAQFVNMFEELCIEVMFFQKETHPKPKKRLSESAIKTVNVDDEIWNDVDLNLVNKKVEENLSNDSVTEEIEVNTTNKMICNTCQLRGCNIF